MSSAPTVTAVCPSPVGDLTLAWSKGALTGLFMQDQRHSPPPNTDWVRDDGTLADVVGQLTAYFDGARTTFDIPLRLQGTEFQVRVWEALRTIPYGQTISYGELARRVGKPSASRAVGLANGRNPIAIIVPCHRVIGADGSLTGYGGGLWRKKILLDLERAAGPNPDLLTSARPSL